VLFAAETLLLYST